MDHEDLKEIRKDLADAEAAERKARFLAECEAERAEREALMDAEMFGYVDYEPNPYDGTYSEC